MKDIRARFAEIEKRVAKLVEENRALKERVPLLERELEKARRTAREDDDFRELRTNIRKKAERALKALEEAEREGFVLTDGREDPQGQP